MSKPIELKYKGFEALQDIYNDIERVVDDLFEKHGYEFLGTVRVSISYADETEDEETSSR
jgi:hypothetical protein